MSTATKKKKEVISADEDSAHASGSDQMPFFDLVFNGFYCRLANIMGIADFDLCNIFHAKTCSFGIRPNALLVAFWMGLGVDFDNILYAFVSNS